MSGDLRDISVALTAGTPEWPGDTPYSCGWGLEIARGASVNVSVITLSPHVGTHADAPLHVRDGWAGAESLPLGAFHGAARVVGLEDAPTVVTADWLMPRVPRRLDRLLLRTGRTIAGGRFPDAWPALSAECVGALLESGLRLLGVDCPSVDERESKTLDAHHALFGGGACILENLDLRDVADGEYVLTAYPIKLDGLDAAPVRAVLEGRVTGPTDEP